MQNDSLKNNSDSSRIENTLNSLGKLQRAEPKPFFYTRLVAKLNTVPQNTWEKYSAFITRPSIAFSGIMLIVIMNIMAAWLNFKTSTVTDQSETSVVDEYSQMASNFYDLENIKP